MGGQLSSGGGWVVLDALGPGAWRREGRSAWRLTGECPLLRSHVSSTSLAFRRAAGKRARDEAKPGVPDSSLANVTCVGWVAPGPPAISAFFLAWKPRSPRMKNPRHHRSPRRYEGMLRLHAAWKSYAGGLARAPEPSTPGAGAGAASLPGRLWQAELHGAMPRVVSCTALPWMAGRRGIVASAARRSMVLVLPEGRRVRVPLAGTVLQYLAGNQLVTLDYSRGLARGGA